jgi:hypothetical protein
MSAQVRTLFLYAKHFTVDFPSAKNSVCVHSIEFGESTYDKSVLSYMRRYKSDERNKMTIKNEQKFECK